ncbi:PKD-like family lipoprotein [Pedobacter frigidisoli]|uniref:PKD-like family lipoprotein n=1 Tax=Pedobacter frigidisoli TaxID=2530455 RepID=UPI00292CF6E3|nr:PKD-like family lipoprotein [Pedobacter frigidisoli]
MKRYITKVFCVLIIISSSCKKTDNDYHEINEGQIKGISANYEVVFKSDRLVIDPTVDWTLDQLSGGDYEYTWKIVATGSSSATALAGTIIGTAKKLDLFVNIDPGSYTLYFKARDKKTDVTWTKSTTLNVTTLAGRGFLLLGDDKDGYADLQMITIKSTGEEFILKNLLANNGLPRLKGAIEVMYTGTPQGSAKDNRKLWVMTKDGGYYLNPLNFESSTEFRLPPMAYISFPTPSEFYPVKLFPATIDGKQLSSDRGALMNNGYFIKNDNVTVSTPEFYSDALNTIAGVPVVIAPYIAYTLSNGLSGSIFYDRTNKQFISNASFSYVSSVVTTAQLAAPLGFPWNQSVTNRDLVYMENTMDKAGSTSTLASTIGNTYALMKDPQSNLFIYKFYPRTRVQLGYFPLTKNFAPGLDAADKYAFYSNRSIMFYTVGNKLFGYDFSVGFEKAKLIKDFGSDQITMLKFDVQNSSTGFNDLYVATYNATSGGTLRRFSVENNPNDVNASETKSWSGLVKIMSIDWRNDQSL